MTHKDTAITSLRADFAGLSQLLSVLFGFAALSLFAEAYVPFKQLLAGAGEPGALSTLWERLAPLLPAVLLLGALWEGRLLFRHLEAGTLLAPLTGRHVRSCGEWILSAAASALIVGAIVRGTAMSWALLVGLAALGLALRSLAGVLDHAAAIQADLDQIV